MTRDTGVRVRTKQVNFRKKYMDFSPGHTKLSIIYGCPWNGVPIYYNWSPPHQDICLI